MSSHKKKILIVDDSELNRSILADMLSGEYDIVEAENGLRAIEILHGHELEISLMLLDIVMPQMDGFAVLSMMNRTGWIHSTPVIMISAETSGTYIDRAYDLGAVDYISRPFDERTVKHRVACNFAFSVRQKEMTDVLTQQIYQKEKDNSLMIEILSHIVEFRNGESGLHVLHVNVITQMLLESLVKKTDKYGISSRDIRMISTASALHDIGKISIPSEILNKPGKFTPEEFEIMKAHTVEGANMLSAIPFRKNEELIKLGHDICRHHHERYDGRGYPDGLKGDDIPISAQVVAIADVYDALTSKRVYKDAYTPEKAVEMIVKGECGAFNPLLLECLNEIAPKLKSELHLVSLGRATDDKIHDTVKQILHGEKGTASDRSIRLFEMERQKFRFLSDISGEIIFEYSFVPEALQLSEWSAELLGLPVRISDPSKSREWAEIFPAEDFKRFLDDIRRTNPSNPVAMNKFLLNLGGQQKWSKVIARALWSDGEQSEPDGVIGKIVDVNDETEIMELLEKKAERDQKTGLLNHTAAKRRIELLIADADAKGKKYALAVLDLDNFKKANDEYGHLFGDEILIAVADRMKENIRSTDIAARVGGDEFILFMEYKETLIPQVDRIFNRITVPYKNFEVKVSMGIATTHGFEGGYDELFKLADGAMYEVKKKNKNGYKIYSDEI